MEFRIHLWKIYMKIHDSIINAVVTRRTCYVGKIDMLIFGSENVLNFLLK